MKLTEATRPGNPMDAPLPPDSQRVHIDTLFNVSSVFKGMEQTPNR